MFSRALALLVRIQERLAPSSGSALNRARMEEARSNTAKQAAETVSLSTPDGTLGQDPAPHHHPSSHPAEKASRRKRKPAQQDSQAKKRMPAKPPASTTKRSSKRGK